jgi:trans-aconitate methyltransferase
MDKWREIWNRDDRVNDYILDTLIKANGFDKGAGTFTLDDWKEYTKEHFDILDIDKSDTIYDIGCGCGAFIYPLYINGHSVSGVDYSKSLIALANSVIPNSNFEHKEANMLDVDSKFDIVVSHSVFQYFKSLYYAEDIIKKMIQKANKKIAIFDINDKIKESEYHRIRMAQMCEIEYKEKYKGLEHMFYEKEWFKELGIRLNVKVNIFDQTFDKYSNSSLRFNVIMEKY